MGRKVKYVSLSQGSKYEDVIKNIDEKVTEYIIIDEISMMKEYFYKMLHTITMFKPNTKIILCGHFE